MHFLSLVLLVFALLAAQASADSATAPRERLLFDEDWRFTLGGGPDGGSGVVIQSGLSVDLSQSFGSFAKAAGAGGPAAPEFDDLGWRRVRIPHDWAVELPFHAKANNSHGNKTIGPGFPATSVGWYRRHFAIPASDANRRMELQFDGVFRDCEVYLNGNYLGRNFSGYVPFAYDITPYLNYGGDNVLAVKVNAHSFEGWFYEGAGIYRHVWLVKTAPVHVPRWGTWITTEIEGAPEAPESATFVVRTTVRNDSDAPASCRLASRVLDAGQATVATSTDAAATIVPAWEEREITQRIPLRNPRLWSLEDPHLYRIETDVLAEGRTTDTYATLTGVRSLRFDAERGFFLNGKHVVIKGTCNHQDHAGVGVALPDRVNVWRLEQLKALGSNAYRASHNPPTPELLDACDRLGILVLDENRTVGATEEALSQVKRLIRRDRNHPSVFMWSLGNEEMSLQRHESGPRIVAPMHRLAKRLDPTRPTTLAMNGAWGESFSHIPDVFGANYLKLGGGFDKFHSRFPERPILGTEEASHTTTRGVYVQDEALRYCHADDTKSRRPSWSSTAEQWMQHYAERPFVAGAFVWTGFDYRGEPTPYGSWPNISSNFGILDTCGFPKDLAYFYRAWWTDVPVLHLLPHWNWPDRLGQPVDVRCDGNAEEVELLLNGRSLGRKPMPRLGHLAWPGIRYEPGVLLARGFSGGKQVSETSVATTGAPFALRLAPDRGTLRANGEDVALVAVSVTDSAGLVVPTANLPITFTLTGPGRLLGMGNGDPRCHEPDQVIAPAPRVLAAPAWTFQLAPNSSAAEAYPQAGDTGWTAAKFAADTLVKGQTGQWRGTLTLSAVEAAADVELSGVTVTGGSARVFVNGTPIAAAIVPATPARTSALPRRVLREGENRISVVVEAVDAKCGLRTAPRLLVPQAPTEAWRRSSFHGLAQVIVQTDLAAGDLVLEAKAEGLAPARLVLTTQSTPARPRVP